MSEQHTQSAIAQLRAQIEAEHQSCFWALHGLSSGSIRHAFIARRQGHMDASYRGLTRLIGEEQAANVLYEVANAILPTLPADACTSARPCCINDLLDDDIVQAYQQGLYSDEEVLRIVQGLTK